MALPNGEKLSNQKLALLTSLKGWMEMRHRMAIQSVQQFGYTTGKIRRIPNRCE